MIEQVLIDRLSFRALFPSSFALLSCTLSIHLTLSLISRLSYSLQPFEFFSRIYISQPLGSVPL